MITLSTVGLGDLVPSLNASSFTFWVFYFVFGLGMIGQMIGSFSDVSAEGPGRGAVSVVVCFEPLSKRNQEARP